MLPRPGALSDLVAQVWQHDVGAVFVHQFIYKVLTAPGAFRAFRAED